MSNSGGNQARLSSQFGKGNDPSIGKATQFKPGQSGNPAGKPKGTKHINTWIQELLQDEDFSAKVRIGFEIQDFKGAPIQAIIKAQMLKAIEGDTKAFDSLAKYGWPAKSEVEQSGEVKHVYEELDDEQLEAAIKAREDRISKTA
jgi:hypothetical protein